jgi:hypothetical protein
MRLTKHAHDVVSVTQASDDEIEITPEMAKAGGICAARHRFFSEPTPEELLILVTDIFIAMMRARREPGYVASLRSEIFDECEG